MGFRNLKSTLGASSRRTDDGARAGANKAISIIKTEAEIEEKRGKRQDKKESRNEEENVCTKLRRTKQAMKHKHKIKINKKTKHFMITA